jgi:tryptophan halogenase
MGYYAEEDSTNLGEAIALMLERRAFPRKPGGGPDLSLPHAFHLENAKFVSVLESSARGMGVEFIDGTFEGVERGPAGVSALVLSDGRKLFADFFIDSSGFRRELIGRVMQEPFIGFESSLFNDRALLASWQRGADEPILPYTTAETMDNGWSWRIDHERVINRGYVYSSAHCTDDQARAEFAAKNPNANINDRILRFNTGRFQRSWVENVLAIGNSCGFVEPLEATALMVICWQAQTFCEMLHRAGATDHIRDLYNRLSADVWDEIRDFLALHFKINTRINTPYWQRCRAEADSPGLGALLDFYHDAGPTEYARYTLTNRDSQFGLEGFLVQLVGNRVPYRNRHKPTREELHFIGALREKHRAAARAAFTVEQTLAFIRHPEWKWNYETKPIESRLYKGAEIPAQYVTSGSSRPRS